MAGKKIPKLKRLGRARLLTPEVQTNLIKGVKLGLAFDHAADAAGIMRATFQNWRKRGREAYQIFEEYGIEAVDPDEHAFLVLFVNIMKADGEGITNAIDTIRGHSKKDWRAAAWIAERTKRRYVPRQQVEETSVHVDITVDDLAAAKKALVNWEQERFSESD